MKMLSPEVLERLNLADFGIAKKLIDGISVPENLKQSFLRLFSGFYLVDSLNPIKFCEELKELDFKKELCLLDGKVLIKKLDGGKVINCNLSETTAPLRTTK